VVDVLLLRKRKTGEPKGDLSWLDIDEVRAATEDEGAIRVNRWFAQHPDFVLGTHALTSGPFGETYTCLPRRDEELDGALSDAIHLLPEALYDGEPTLIDLELETTDDHAVVDLRSYGQVREGSFFVDNRLGLMQVIDGEPVAINVRKGRGGDGIPEKHARIIIKLIPVRDALRAVLKAQELDQPWKDSAVRLRIAWSGFIREFGPINGTVVSITEDLETGDIRETHRRPNLQPFLDDPDCWLVASIEDYDLENDTARPGPIFTERVISPPSAPIIASTADALAVVLNERGHIDIDHIAELLHVDVETVIADLGDAIFSNPETGAWQTADAYLSGQVRDKLKVAEAAASLDPVFERNVRALIEVQPADLRPSDITARLGEPWIPAADVIAFVHETMGAEIKIHHMPELASWTVEARQLGWLAVGTSEWSTDRRNAGELIADALNSRVPQIFDTVKDGDSEKRVLNVVDTEADAKQRLFGDVRAGKVRFLIGSSDTMGAGVNAQLRLKALHHLDVPWLPSQIEQREGRILRQGNQHDVIDIFAYATEGSMDAQMWQNNERKARFIAAALSGDTSIRRLEDMGEGQASQFAMAKAIASGDPRLMQKAGLEADIARLERLRAAHMDDQHAIRRQIRDAERDIEYSTRRVSEVGQDIERLVPTAGDGFSMVVEDDTFTERKLAGRALMKEILTLVQLQQEGDTVIASIGGFDLEYSGERFGKDGYRYATMLMRTGVDHEIETPMTVTPLGAISRLEHAIDDFEGERKRYYQRLADARRRLGRRPPQPMWRIHAVRIGEQ
jgi:hypothetical protein